MNLHHSLRRIVVVLAVAAVAAPMAQARTSGLDDWFRDSGAKALRLAVQPQTVVVDAYFRDARSTRSNPVQRIMAQEDYRGVADDYFRDASNPVLIRVTGGGFDWGDAGIGAAGGFALALAVAGSGLMVLRRRMGGGGQTGSRYEYKSGKCRTGHRLGPP